MLDAPGPWGTGPFVLKEGYSSINARIAIIDQDPFAATWLFNEERTPYVVLEANRHYWNPTRGPRLERVVFRNDITREQALELCIGAEGQVDLVKGVLPHEAQKVLASPYANLVEVDGNYVMAGIFNRFQQDVPLDDRRAREAINLAINRDKLVRDVFLGYATATPALTPPWFFDAPTGLQPKPYDPVRARKLFQQVGWPSGRPLRLAAPALFARAARVLAGDLESTLGISVEVVVIPPELQTNAMRVLIEKKLLPNWDVLLTQWYALFAEATPAFIHREFFGADGALRAGPKIPEFDKRFAAMSAETNRLKRTELAKEIDRYVHDEALALFLCAPHTLYAVNKHVHFRPYRTSLEFAETEVDTGHWSRRSST